MNVIVILGPTCSGKTELSIEIASKIKSEIVSADSRQIYKYLDIGTAKPNFEQRAKVKHYFIDILSPDENYNAHLYSKQANATISNIIKNNNVPIVVGGSTLYLKALIDGINVPVDTNQKLRNDLMEKRNLYGDEFLFEQLKKADPVSAEKLNPKDYKRIIRALEVFYLTNKQIWKFQSETNVSPFNFVLYGIYRQRNILYQKINQRVDKMIADGLIEETNKILSSGFEENLNSLNTVGYREIIDFIKGRISLENAIYLIKRNTRRFAKRQITWFKEDKRIKWFNADEFSTSQIADKILEDFYERKNSNSIRTGILG